MNMMRTIVLAICIAMGVSIGYSQKPIGKVVVVENISVDSLSTLLKEALSAVNKQPYYRVTVTSDSEKVTPGTRKEEDEYIKENIKRYLSGDTIRLTCKDKEEITTYVISKK